MNPDRKIVVSVSLTPGQIDRVDAHARLEGWSRSAVIGQLIDSHLGGTRSTVGRQGTAVVDETSGAVIREAQCAHTKTAVIAGGLKACKDCGATRGADGNWRDP